MSRLMLMPLEERIVLDGAIAVDIAAVAAPEPANVDPSNAHLVVISQDIADADVLENAVNDGAAVVVYDPTETDLNALSQQINEALDGNKVQDVSFVTDGSEGFFKLVQNHSVTTDSLQETVLVNFWQDVASNIIPDGDVNILGCNVAGDDAGIEMLEMLDSVLDGVGYNIDVNASVDLTGHSDLGGNWSLEFSTDPNASTPINLEGTVFDSAGLSQWENTLVSVINTTVFRDLDLSGTHDPGEDGIQGVTVNLYRSSDPTNIDPFGSGVLEASVITDSNGIASFTNIPAPDNYVLEYEIPVGHTVTTPNYPGNDAIDSDALTPVYDYKYVRTDFFTPANGATVNNIDAGFVYQDDVFGVVTIGDTVWNDINANGTQDNLNIVGGEPGLNGVDVTLYGNFFLPDGSGTPTATLLPLLTTTTPTDSATPGDYEFTDIIPLQSTLDIIFVVDISGSTDWGWDVSSPTVGDVNNDGDSNDVIDAELAALSILTDDLLNKGFDAGVRIGVIAFESSAQAVDLEGDGTGDFDWISPSDISDGTGNYQNGANFTSTFYNDVINVSTSGGVMNPGGGTDYEQAFIEASDYFTAGGTQPQNGILIFLTDGVPSSSGYADELTTLRNQGIDIRALGLANVNNGPSMDVLRGTGSNPDIDPRAEEVSTEPQLFNYFNGFLSYSVTGYAIGVEKPTGFDYSPTFGSPPLSNANDSDINPSTGVSDVFTVSTLQTQSATNVDAGLFQGIEIVKTMVDENGGLLEPGDTILYTIQLTNNAADNFTFKDVTVTDDIPTNTTLDTSSLLISAGVGAGTTMTATTGDDQGEESGGTLTFWLGAGAAYNFGGDLNSVSSPTTTVQYRVTVDDPVADNTEITNQAFVDYWILDNSTLPVGNFYPPTEPSNIVTETVNSITDLDVTKTAINPVTGQAFNSTDYLGKGQTIIYQITVDHDPASNNTAQNVVFTDDIDLLGNNKSYTLGTIKVDGVQKTDTNTDGDGVSYDVGTQVITVDLGDIAVDDPEIIITFEVMVSGTAISGTYVENSGTLDYTDSTGNVSQTTNTSSLPISSAYFDLEKTAVDISTLNPINNLDTVEPGQQIRYEVKIDMTPDSTSSVWYMVFIDELDADITLIDNNGSVPGLNISLSPDGGTTWTEHTADINDTDGDGVGLFGSTLQIDFNDISIYTFRAEADPPIVVSFDVEVDSGAANGDHILNTGKFFADSSSTIGGLGSISAASNELDFLVDGESDFTVTKTSTDVNGGDVLPGDTITYTVIATNTGTDQATDIVFSDLIPSGLTFSGLGTVYIDSSPAGSLADFAGSTLTVWLGSGASSGNGGTLNTGQSTTVTFDVTVDAGSDNSNITNTATINHEDVNGGPQQPDIGTNLLSVGGEPDLDISKTFNDITQSAIHSGDEIEYSITITNNGTDTASDVVFSDVIPSEVTFNGLGTVVVEINSSPVTTFADFTGGTLTVWLGSGAGAGTGGSLAVGDTAVITFDVTVDTVATGTTISNTGTVNYEDPTSNVMFGPENSLPSEFTTEAAGISVTPTTGLETDESGGTAQFTVVLDSKPSGTVTINLNTSDPTEGVPDQTTLTFNPTNWDQPQTVTITGQDDPVYDGDIPYTIVLDPAVSADQAYNGIDPLDVSVVNLDNETAPVVSINDVSQSEATSPMTFTVSLSVPSTQTITIPFSTQNGTAVTPGDYTSIPVGSVTFAPSTDSTFNQTQEISVIIINDNYVEANETFFVVLGEPTVGDATLNGGGTTTQGTGTIENDDSLTVSITPFGSPFNVVEGGTQDFTVTVVGDIEPGHEVDVTVEQIGINYPPYLYSASIGNDPNVNDLEPIDPDLTAPYEKVLTFSAAGSQVITVTTTDDVYDEPGPNQTYGLHITDATIDGSNNGITIDPAIGVAEIIDNDNVPTVFFDPVIVQQVESITTMTFTIKLGGPSEAQIDVPYYTNDLTAIAGDDYIALGSSSSPLTLSFAPGETEKTIDVTIVNDSFVEVNESFELVLLAPDPQYAELEFGGAMLPGLGVIQNDDVMVVTIQNPDPNPAEVVEGNSQDYDVVVSGATFKPGDSLEVVLQVTGDTATIPDDLDGTILPSTTLTFDENTPNQTITITIPTLDDNIVENTETYTVSIVSATLTNTAEGLNETLDNSSTQQGSILDDDVPGYTITPPAGGTLETSEPNTTDSFTIVLDNKPESNVIFNVVSLNPDEATAQTPIIFTPDNWDQPQTVVVTGADDFLIDGTQPFTIEVSVDPTSDPLWTGVANQTVPGENLDNDFAALDIEIPGGSVILHTEDGTTDEFTVALTAQPDPGEIVVVDISSQDPGEGGNNPTQITFDHNNWNIPQTITVTGTDDPIYDGDIAYIIDVVVNNTLTTDQSFLGVNGTVPGLNLDNDNPPIVTVSPAVSVEGNNGDTNQLIFLVQLSHASTFVISIPYFTTDGTAFSTGVEPDFVSQSGTLQITNLDTQGEIVIDIVGDLYVEADEQMTLTLQHPTNAVFDEADTIQTIDTTGTIQNDDELSVAISNATPGLQQEGGQQTFNVTVSGGEFGINDELVIDFSGVSGSATADLDFSVLDTSPLVFTSAGTQTITVDILNDNLYEPGLNEDYTISLDSVLLNGSQTGITVTQSQGAGLIEDTNVAPVININPIEVAQDEGTDPPPIPMGFTIVLSNATTETLVIPIFTTDGTAVSTGVLDFFAVKNTNVIIPGSTNDNLITSQVFDVVIVPDPFHEADEQFTITILEPTSGEGSLGPDNTATGTIINDDFIDISVTDATVTELDQDNVIAYVDIVLSTTSESEIQIYYQTSDGTAVSPDDYTAIPQSIAIFQPHTDTYIGDTVFTIPITVLPDNISEGDENFFVDISFVNPPDPSEDITIVDDQGEVTIQDDDGTPGLYLITPDAILEGNTGISTYRFPIILSNPSSTDITVEYTVTDGLTPPPPTYPPGESAATTADSDYSDPATTDEITFIAGEQIKFIDIDVIGDYKLEDNELFTVTLTQVTTGNADINANYDVAVGEIANDDAVPAVTINDVTQLIEGTNADPQNNKTPFTFTISLSAPVEDDVTVTYETMHGSAIGLPIPKIDYDSIPSTQVVIPAGDTSVDVTVYVYPDSRFEDNETFFVKLTGVSDNAWIEDDTGEGIINNDDQGTGASVATQVWADVYDYGTYNETGTPVENGISDLEVKLVHQDGNDWIIETTQTNLFGQAIFNNIQSDGDSYYLLWEIPEYYSPTTTFYTDPLASGTDSDAVSTAPPVPDGFVRSNAFVINQNDQIFDVDAGFVFGDAEPKTGGATISNFVWDDLNHNGIQDNGEPGLEGITVNLYANSLGESGVGAVLVATTTTDANGFYEFKDLPATTDLWVSHTPTIIFVADLSTSASTNMLDGGIISPDTTILQAEIDAFKALVNQINGLGIGGNTQIGIVGFGSTADNVNMDPTGGTTIVTTAANADLNGNSISDVIDILNGLTAAGVGVAPDGSNYQGALAEVNTILGGLPAAPEMYSVLMLTDGLPTGNDFVAEATTLAGLANNVRVYGLGDAKTYGDPNDPTYQDPSNGNPYTVRLSEQGNTHQPVEVNLTLDRGTPVNFDISVLQTDLAILQPLDVYFLEDLTSSFSNDIVTIKQIVPDIVNGLSEFQSDLNVGFGSFQDKPYNPFGSSSNYVFANNFTIAEMIPANITALTDAIGGLSTNGGGDNPEASLEALLHAGLSLTSGPASPAPTNPDYTVNTGLFRPDALKIIILSTDITGHVAGDHPGTPNNGDNVINYNEDYPSIDQVKTALNLDDGDISNDIIPLFLISGNSSTTNFWNQVVADLGVGGVTALSDDSSNIIDAIKAGLKSIVSDLSLTVTSDDFSYIPLSSTNPNPNSHSNIQTGETADFNVTFELPINLELYRNDVITIFSDTQIDGTPGNTTVNIFTENALVELQKIDPNAFMVTTADQLLGIFSGIVNPNSPEPGPNFPSSYFLEFKQQDGYVLTAPNVGGDDTIDSDADQVTERTDPFILVAQETNDTVDAGMALPVITITGPASPIDEGDSGFTPFTFTITVDYMGKFDVNVNYQTLDGDGIPTGYAALDQILSGEKDYQGITQSLVSFGAEIPTPTGTSMTHQVTVDVLGDNKYEQDEDFRVQLSAPTSVPANAVIDTTPAYGIIQNDDQAPVINLVPINNTTELEGTEGRPFYGNIITSPGEYAFKITLSNPTYEDLTIEYFTADGMPMVGFDAAMLSDGDYVEIAQGTTVTIHSGLVETDSFAVYSVADPKYENNENFNLNIGEVTGSDTNVAGDRGVNGGTDKVDLFVTNDDDPPFIIISDPAELEGTPPDTANQLIFNVMKFGETAFDLTFDAAFADGSPLILTQQMPATGSGPLQDYTVVGPTTITFASGEYDQIIQGNKQVTVKTITVDTIPDFMHEFNEVFNTTLNLDPNTSTPVNVGPEYDTTNSVLIGVGTILNDDDPPKISIVPTSPTSINEGTIGGPNEPPGGTPTNPAFGTVNFDIVMSNPSFENISVFAETFDGTLTIQSLDFTNEWGPAQTPDNLFLNDYIPITNDQPIVVFPTGSQFDPLTGEVKASFSVSANADDVFEFNEWLTVQVTGVSGDNGNYAEVDQTQDYFEVEIVNDDAKPILILSPPVDIDEETHPDGTPTLYQFDIERLGATSFDTVLTSNTVLATTGPMAYPTDDPLNDNDFYPIINKQNTIFASTDHSVVVNNIAEVGVVPDNKHELNEKFALHVKASDNSLVGNTNSEVTEEATIVNDDFAPLLTINDVTLSEGAEGNSTIFTFTIRLSNPTYNDVVFGVSTADGTSPPLGPDNLALVSDNDYIPLPAGLEMTYQELITDPNNPVSPALLKPVYVEVLNDEKHELTESFYVNLTPTQGAISPQFNDLQGQGNIENDDPEPIVSFTPLINSIPEGDTGVVLVPLSIELDRPTYQDLTFVFGTRDGGSGFAPATVGGNPQSGGQDYQRALGQVTILENDTAANVTAIINSDFIFEPNEAFTMVILNITGDSDAPQAKLSQIIETSEIIIINDDSPIFVIPKTENEQNLFEKEPFFFFKPEIPLSGILGRDYFPDMDIFTPRPGIELIEGSALPPVIISELFVESEGDEGIKGWFEIYLSLKPSHPVTISFETINMPEGALSTDSVTFEPDEWQVVKKVYVTADADLDVPEGEDQVIVTDPAVSEDSNFNDYDPQDLNINQELEDKGLNGKDAHPQE